MKKNGMQAVSGLIGILLGIGIGYAIVHKAPQANVVQLSGEGAIATDTASQLQNQSVTGGTSFGSSKPIVTVGTPRITVVRSQAAFDMSDIASTSSYPVITGTANIPKVNVVVDNAKGVGIVESNEISVVNGHWSYWIPLKLTSGTYTVLLGGAGEIKRATLTVASNS